MKTATASSILGIALLLAVAVLAQAQQPKKVPRIGYLTSGEPARDTRAEAIRLALLEWGYIEGQNIATEYRYAVGRSDRLHELAAGLVRLKVDINPGRRSHPDPSGHECDQEDSYRYDGPWDRSSRGRPS
jgi:hypothetical protein